VSIEHLLICQCGEVLIKSIEGEIKLRSKIVVFKKGGAVAVCKGCGKELSIPVALDKQDLLLKSRRPPLFIIK
jgi:hypothetical protein